MIVIKATFTEGVWNISTLLHKKKTEVREKVAACLRFAVSESMILPEVISVQFADITDNAPPLLFTIDVCASASPRDVGMITSNLVQSLSKIDGFSQIRFAVFLRTSGASHYREYAPSQ